MECPVEIFLTGASDVRIGSAEHQLVGEHSNRLSVWLTIDGLGISAMAEHYRTLFFIDHYSI